MPKIEARSKSILKKCSEDTLFHEDTSTSTQSSSTSTSTQSSDLSSESPNTLLDDDDESIHVKFQNIEIRNYDMTIGDNPACSYGPPVSLDWKYAEASAMPLEEYEESRGARRKSYQMHLNVTHRKKILEGWDITEDEMNYVAKEVKDVRKGRERTKMMLPFWKLEDAAESTKRKINRASAV